MSSKAKKVHSISITGDFSLDTMEIVEVTKDAEYTYDFLSILKDFDGKNITVTLKEQDEIPVKE